MTKVYRDDWRRRKSGAFDLATNSTAGRTVTFDLWGRSVEVYANANLSVYSGQACNARCAFCVEELRPASRGAGLAMQKRVESDDTRYFAALAATLEALRPLDPSVSVTGGEPSLDPRLPRILALLAGHGARRMTLTTNGSGLLREQDGRRIVDHIVESGVRHLNLSRAHVADGINARLMGFRDAPDAAALREIVLRCKAGGTRVRLSCVLVRGAVDDLAGILGYLDFAASLGVDNVIFRQLMLTDPATVARNPVVRFSDRKRVLMEPLLDAIGETPGFELQRQVMGYYYYVEVWRRQGMDVVFEEADLARLEMVRRINPGVLHELVFHPDGMLASTWQPWDGVLGPPPSLPANANLCETRIFGETGDCRVPAGGL